MFLFFKIWKITHLYDSEKDYSVDKTGKKQRNNKHPLPCLYGSCDQIPFGKESTGRRDADNRKAANEKYNSCHRHFVKNISHGINRPSSCLKNNGTCHHKKGQGHHSISKEMVNSPGQTVLICKPDTSDHITDLSYNNITEHSFYIMLSQSRDRSKNNGSTSHPHNSLIIFKCMKNKLN